MRAGINATAQALRTAGKKIIEYDLIWLAAKDRDTGNVEGVGFWGGDGAHKVSVPDLFTGLTVARTFFNRTLLRVGSIKYTTGVEVRSVGIDLAASSPLVETALRYYEPRGAEVQIWRQTLHPTTRLHVAVEPRFAGFVDDLSFDRGGPGTEDVAHLEIVSTARFLAFVSGAKKSHEASRRRGDDIRQYKGTTGTWEVKWINGTPRSEL